MAFPQIRRKRVSYPRTPLQWDVEGTHGAYFPYCGTFRRVPTEAAKCQLTDTSHF